MKISPRRSVNENTVDRWSNHPRKASWAGASENNNCFKVERLEMRRQSHREGANWSCLEQSVAFAAHVTVPEFRERFCVACRLAVHGNNWQMLPGAVCYLSTVWLPEWFRCEFCGSLCRGCWRTFSSTVTYLVFSSCMMWHQPSSTLLLFPLLLPFLPLWWWAAVTLDSFYCTH